MAETRKIIRAFLASPSDLQEERKAIREVVNELNEMFADLLGYQVELIGWEETVAGFGRPQEIINQDLDRCDVDEKFDDAVALTIYKLGKDRISELLLIDMSDFRLEKILLACSETVFNKVEDDVLFDLFNNDSQSVRKTVAMMAVKTLSKKRLEVLLDKYVNGDNYRFYNVIHWLDLGASMSRNIAKRVVLNEMENQIG